MSATKEFRDYTTVNEALHLWMGAVFMLALQGWDWFSFLAVTLGIPSGMWLQPRYDRCSRRFTAWAKAKVGR